MSIEASVPLEYDARALRPRCAAWSAVMDQGSIASCCSFAISTALSARECLRDGRDTLYAAQQIWDCSGPSISDAQNGTLLQSLINAMGDVSSPYSAYFLIPHRCASSLIQSSPSLARCSQSFRSCNGTSIIPPIKTSSTFRLSTFNGPNDYGVILAARYMMMEIMQSGPVIGVLAMATVADRLRFQTLPPDAVFSPDTEVTEPSYHCLVAYGWGIRNGVRFWRVQNSYGKTWSDGGFGLIGLGTLERDWRSVSTPSRPCNNALCLYPPAVDDETNRSETQHPKIVPPKDNNYDMLLIPNAAIVSITIVSSLIIAWIIFLLIRPARFFNPIIYYS